MKRSEINQALKEMEAMIREYRIALPPFCNLTPQEWQGMNHEYDEIWDNMLGWISQIMVWGGLTKWDFL